MARYEADISVRPERSAPRGRSQDLVRQSYGRALRSLLNAYLPEVQQVLGIERALDAKAEGSGLKT
jgi:hypothetical protein